MVSRGYWRTDSQSRKRTGYGWPSITQIIRQVALVVVVLAGWSGLLTVYLNLVGQESGMTTAASAPEVGPAAVAAAAATATSTKPSPPTDTPVPPTGTPTATATPTPTLTPTETPAGDQSQNPEEATATFTPTPTKTATPTATPLPTATPVPPTNTPAPTATPVPPPTAAEGGGVQVSFAADVFPILQNRCIKCHGGKDRLEEGLDLTSYEAVMQGSWNGRVVEPGDPEDSYLYELVVKGEMPNKEPRLLPGQIRTIEAWIAAGAPNN